MLPYRFEGSKKRQEPVITSGWFHTTKLKLTLYATLYPGMSAAPPLASKASKRTLDADVFQLSAGSKRTADGDAVGADASRYISTSDQAPQ